MRRPLPPQPDLSRGPSVYRLGPDDVVFEDADLIAVNKPPGLPSQATLDPSRHHLARAIEEFLKARDGDAYVGQHHRLDVGTSGVMVFTKSRAANAGVAEAFKSHSAKKTYLALAGGKKAERGRSWRVKNHLAEVRKGFVGSVRSGGDPADTEFKILAVGNGALIEARPHTGRRHQIRVHLAEDSRPIFGDTTYADAKTAGAADRLMLHALKLEIPHPLTGARLILSAPPRQDFLAFAAKLGIAYDWQALHQ